jgi:hypothetical protein
VDHNIAISPAGEAVTAARREASGVHLDESTGHVCSRFRRVAKIQA